jgi:hypothetical protein
MKLRQFLIVPFLACAVGHAILCSRWIKIWGFWGSLLHWFETFSDPISAAAGLDLMVLMVVVGLWMLYREGRWNRLITFIFIPYLIFPAPLFFLYLMISKKSLPGESAKARVL